MESVAVEWGIPAQDYWTMTFLEIIVQVSANKRRHDLEMKEKAMFDYRLAQLNMYALNDPKKMPSMETMYPFFKEAVEQSNPQNVKTAENQPAIPPSQTPYSMDTDKAIFMQMAAAVKKRNEER